MAEVHTCSAGRTICSYTAWANAARVWSGASVGFRDAVFAVFQMLLGLPSGFHPVGTRGRWFVESLSIIGIVVGGYALIMLLRPVIYRRRTWRPERVRADLIAAEHGHSALTEFTLALDKQFFFSHDRMCYISYRVGDVALALGNPVGPADRIVACVTAFLAFSEENGWIPAFYQVGATWLGAYQSIGLKSMKVGEEAVIDLETFTLEGAEAKDFRYALNRFRKMGMQVLFVEPPVSLSLLQRLKPVSDEWLRQKGRARNAVYLYPPLAGR